MAEPRARTSRAIIFRTLFTGVPSAAVWINMSKAHVLKLAFLVRNGVDENQRESWCCSLEEMLAERGVDVDHTTVYRWVQRYAPLMEKHLRWYWKRPSISRSWRVDETARRAPHG